MTLKEAIIGRRSVRTYTTEPVKDSLLDDLKAFIANLKPLNSGIKADVAVISREDFNRNYRGLFVPGTAQHFIIISSVQKEGYLENAGFIGEQIALFLAQHEAGTCWLGFTAPRKPENSKLPHVVALCFGRPDNAPRRLSPEEANRMLIHEIVMGKISHPDLLPLIEAGRLAPSALNLQPVRYITESRNIFIYRKRPLISIPMLEALQCIDVGIAMANIYVQSDFTRAFIKEKNFPTPHGNCVYEYSAVDASSQQ